MTTERAAQPGERCTCGRQAVAVFVRDNGSEVGYCGLPDGGERTGPCPFCGASRHREPWADPAPCPQYQLQIAPCDRQTSTVAPPLELTAQDRLSQAAHLVTEYAALAEHTGNGDLIALLFQLQQVLGDEVGRAG